MIDEVPVSSSGGSVGLAPALVSMDALVAELDSALARNPSAFRVEDLVPDSAVRAAYVARAASGLASPSWQTRNVAVKLLGSLRAVDGVDLLVELLRDKRLAPWYKRLFGGDFVQVGFIRRNALVSLRRIDHVTAAVEEVTTAALGDPYYEARVEAARSIGALGTGFSASGRHQAAGMLARALGDRWLEVVVRAAEALGEVGEGPEALSALLGLRTHRFWIVRAAALRGLRALVERGEVEEVSALAAEVRGFILAATDFRPEFTIRTSYAQLLAAIRSRTEGTSCCR